MTTQHVNALATYDDLRKYLASMLRGQDLQVTVNGLDVYVEFNDAGNFYIDIFNEGLHLDGTETPSLKAAVQFVLNEVESKQQ